MSVQTRKVWMVRANNKQEQYDDVGIAARRVIDLLHLMFNEYDARFPEAFLNGHSLSWSEEEVPATSLDELLAEYDDAYGLDELDRSKRYLLIERNVRGSSPPYAIATDDDLTALYRGHRDQEYASDWELEGIYEMATGNEVAFEVEVQVKEK